MSGKSLGFLLLAALRCQDADAAQPGEFRIIVRCDLVMVDGRRLEPGDRRRMPRAENHIADRSDGSQSDALQPARPDHELQ